MLHEITDKFIFDLKNESNESKPTPKTSAKKTQKTTQIQLIFDAAKVAITNIKDEKLKAAQIEVMESGLYKLLNLSKGNLSFEEVDTHKTLSSILADIKNTIAQIGSIQNLPPEATVIQAETVTVTNDSISKIESIQKTTIDFVSINYSRLELVKKDLDDPAVPIDAILLIMHEISNNAILLKIEVDKLDTKVTMAKIGELVAQSNALQAKYSQQVATLELQITDAKNRLNQAEQNRWYYLALGIFGLPGIIAAAVVISNITNEVNDLANRINEDTAKLILIRNFSNSVSVFSTLFKELFGEIIFLKNDIDFIIGQISNIIQNLENPTVDRSVLSLYVITTLETFKQLEADAS